MKLMKHAETGYTLVEILVVLFIISIVTTVALLSIHRNDNREIETFAKEVSQVVALAEEQAMLQANVLGMSVSQHGVSFKTFENNDTTHKSNWQPVEDHVLTLRKLPNNMQMKVDVGNNAKDADSKNPQIVISTNGDITPFTIYIGEKGKKPLYAITGDADGHVTTRLLS